MKGFINTLVYGLAGLCVLLIAAGVTALSALRANGMMSASGLRPLVLSAQELAYLKDMRERPSEPPEAPHNTHAASDEEMLTRLADMANAEQATQLVTRLRRQQEALDERQTWLDHQWADLQLAKSGLERMQRQAQDQERRLTDQAKDQDAERTRWAVAQAAETERMQVIGEVEKARYKDQAKLFEQMKDAAWTSLRRFEPREIARYLALMDPKKASRLLVLAQQDADYPNAALLIHREMLHLDLDGATGDQNERLATLYSFMPAETILAYLKSALPQGVADILLAMERKGQAKKRAEIMEALRKEDSKREMDVRLLLEKAQSKEAKQ